MTKSKELRDMSDEQLELTGKDAVDKLFRARIQRQTEKLDAPSQLRQLRRLIARIKTIQTQRIASQKKTAAVAK
jgi:large subunit ribosomal protein L29